ncbi:TPA: fimbrial protein [Klebsiella aerogenes]
MVANITAGEDLTVGTRLLHQVFDTNAGSISVECTSEGQVMGIYSLSKTPLPLSSWGNGSLAGTIYETGVSGVGIGFKDSTSGANPIPESVVATSSTGEAHPCTPTSTNCVATTAMRMFALNLYKTGPISPGVIQGANLPCVALNMSNAGDKTSSNQVEEVCVTGSINIVAATCQTPDVTVLMGSHDIKEFTGKGSAAKWVDASINLTGCPHFYGYGAKAKYYNDSSDESFVDPATNNSLHVTLTPNTTVIDDANGIFSIAEGVGAAQGIGIQLAYGSIAGDIESVSFSTPKDITLALNSSGNTKIPLVARYIQTESNIQAGKADSAVTYLIDYY